ncbi:LOW QUALITY PROTEIN: chemokine XC receptor 1-like [Colossoma macropomum]|uniref:LOW QUALITY PROTEIN: chemokine XC receptor 1-like n=1 Tax=Colossoma macropomum TaxID=42526 RepID=UPI0018644DCC|nr:LOW QUALITY PROTEIN: chemokine XC receptor 1-like [Colossoma macropomum]
MFHNELCSYEAVTKFGSIVVPIVFTIVVLLSLIGNILVLVILGLYENLKSLTNIFILNLALSDLIFTLGLPFCVSYYIWSWTFGDFMCKAMNFIFSAGFYSSTVFLMLMSIQRYLAVVHPLSDWNKRQRFAAILILAWTFSFAAALPDLLFSKVKVNSALSKNHYCEFNNIKAGAVFTYQQNILFVVAFSVMGFCYIRIIQTILRSQTNNRHRTRRLIFCIVVVFFVGWAPYNIVIFLRTYTDHRIKSLTECDVSSPLEYVFYVCKLLAFSHCFINPVLYVFVGVKFRNHLRKLLQKIFQS